MRGLDGLMNHKYVYGQEEWRPWEAMYQTYDPVKNINTTAFGRLLHYYKHCFGEEIPVEAYSGRMPNCGILGGHVDVVLPFLEKMLGWSRRAAAGRAELRALTFLEARYGAISAKMQTAGTLPGNLPVPCRYPVHFAGA